MEYAVEMKNISKSFGSVKANRGVSLNIRRGEILSLLGENGSGKTTLMNMLSGIYFPDEGQIFVGGREVAIRSPRDAHNAGIGMIHQHFKLVDVLNAAENIILGYDDGAKFDMKAVAARVRGICGKYGFALDPLKKVYNMSVSEKQTLEIVKALYRGAEILILDEPTAVLTPQETERLFAVIRNMRDDGKSVVIITHKLHEVLAVSDRAAILRRGEYVGCVDTADATELSLTEMMVGQRLELNIERPEPKDPHRQLEIKNLSCRNADGFLALEDISFTVYSGEILGIAGISGCGQKELLEAIAGLQRPLEGGSIRYFQDDEGKEVSELIGKTPRQIRELGVALSFVPEDRLGMGLVGSMGMLDNMMLKNYRAGASVFTERQAPRELAGRITRELEVVTPDVKTPVRRLSGGNVQKVLLGREIAAAPRVLMTAYAVRGLDINTSYTIYRLLNEQKKLGVAVIYVGEDLDVLLALSDRVLVMCAGRVSGIVDARRTTKEEVGRLMTTLPAGGAIPNKGRETEGQQTADSQDK